MRDFNKAILVGRLGQDVETRQGNDGKLIAKFSMATTKKFSDKGDGVTEETQWHRIVCFGNNATFAHKFLKKGDLVLVEGEIRYRKWVSKEGVPKESTEIYANDIGSLGSKNQGSSGESGGGGSREAEDVGSDLPF